MLALEREHEKVKTQHVSRKSEGPILYPRWAKGKCDTTCSKVQVHPPQPSELPFVCLTYTAPNTSSFSVSKSSGL